MVKADEPPETRPVLKRVNHVQVFKLDDDGECSGFENVLNRCSEPGAELLFCDIVYDESGQTFKAAVIWSEAYYTDNDSAVQPSL